MASATAAKIVFTISSLELSFSGVTAAWRFVKRIFADDGALHAPSSQTAAPYTLQPTQCGAFVILGGVLDTTRQAPHHQAPAGISGTSERSRERAMYFCFVDESGTPPGSPNPSKPYFTLGALIVRYDDWPSLANKVQGYRTRHRLNGELKWRYFSPHNREDANPLQRFDAEQRRALSAELGQIVAAAPVTLLACVVDVERAFSFPSVNNQQELYHFTYKPITERFQYFLQDQDSLGIIVADHRGRDSDKLLRAHHVTLTNNPRSTRSTYSRLIEGLFLQDSSHSIGIQLADFVAGAIHRSYAAGDGSHATPLKAKLRRDAQGQILGRGLILHPKNGFRTGLARLTPGGAVAPTP